MGLRSWWPLLLGASLGVGAALAIPSFFEVVARSEEEAMVVPLPSRLARPAGATDPAATDIPATAVKGPEPTTAEEEFALRFSHPGIRAAMWLYFTGRLPEAREKLEKVRADRAAWEHHLLADALLSDLERVADLERRARDDLSRHSPAEAADKLRQALSIDARLTEPARLADLPRDEQEALRARMTSAQRKTLASLYLQYTRDRGKMQLKTEPQLACASWRLGLDFAPGEGELEALMKKECVPRALAAATGATQCHEVRGLDLFSTNDPEVETAREAARRRLCSGP